MKIIFAGGGTAGHINPSIAIAEELKRRGDTAVFVSRSGGGENSLITDEGYKLYTYRVSGLKKTPLGLVRALRLAALAGREAEKILLTERPDILFCTGGYVSYPILKAAIRLGIPTALHESNAKPGLVTRLLSKKCNLVMLPESYGGELKANEVRVGTPIKRSFSATRRQDARRALSLSEKDTVILSLGGSLGARTINDTVLFSMKRLTAKYPDLKWFHSTGNRYYEKLAEEYPELISNKAVSIMPYINDMPRLLCASDIVISRCGAVTLSEILEAKIPTILIPSPNVADDHQRKNAKSLIPKDASIIIDEEQLSPEKLCSTLDTLIREKSQRASMKQAYKSAQVKSPREKITELLYELHKNSR